MAGYDITIWSYSVDVTDPGDISGYAIHAIDGDIGKVDKHDAEAGSSYLLVATGPWILGKTVMLPAGVIERIDHENETVYVARTKDQHAAPAAPSIDRREDRGDAGCGEPVRRRCRLHFG